MKIQAIQNNTFRASESSGKGKKFYKGMTGVVLAAGVCSLASDRLFKSPKNLPKLSKFGFWTTWAGLGLFALGIGKSIYDKAMKANAED